MPNGSLLHEAFGVISGRVSNRTLKNIMEKLK